jgi:uncharacterized protein YbjT (DUF2867 family)
MGSKRIVITGATGYMGRSLIPILLSRGHQVTAVARSQSVALVPPCCAVHVGNVLDGESWRGCLSFGDTLVHLVGVPHPSPAKAKEFIEIDRRGAMEAIRVAKVAGIAHFIYLSVAHPAPMMKAYIAVRAECEAALRESGLHATIVRPWYVLGPGHRWPYALLPLYWVAERLPATQTGARRLGLVTLRQMTRALCWAVENPPADVAILDVPGIREKARL